MRSLTWSQERAEKKQAELIGLTAYTEIDHKSLFSKFEEKFDPSEFEPETMVDANTSNGDRKASFDMPLASGTGDTSS